MCSRGAVGAQPSLCIQSCVSLALPAAITPSQPHPWTMEEMSKQHCQYQRPSLNPGALSSTEVTTTALSQQRASPFHQPHDEQLPTNCNVLSATRSRSAGFNPQLYFQSALPSGGLGAHFSHTVKRRVKDESLT